MEIGVDLGGSHIAVGVVSSKKIIIAKREKDIEKHIKKEEMKDYIVDNIKILISEVIRDIGAPSCIISKIGIATPGKVKNNVIYDMYNLEIDEFDLCNCLSEYYGVEVKARNDAKCAALAEKTVGNMKNYEDGVFLCLGTGIGGATFINGRMLEYTKDNGSEYGHMIIKKDGLICNCGNKGCFEKYASMKAFKTGIIKLLNLNENIQSKELLEILKIKVKEKNIEVNDYIDQYIDNLQVGLVNIINIFEPDVICLGGSFTYYDEILYTRLIEKMNLKKYNCSIPKIILAKLQNDAGIIGSLM